MKNVYLIPTNPNDETKKGIWIKETRDWSNIYIISEEEIKEGDWCINTKRINEKINFPDKIIGKADYTANVLIGSSWKKIILTTDQDLINDGVQAIDEDFIEWFVNNPDCEWVDVDTRPKVSSPYEKGFVIDNPNYNKIIISKEEQKQHLIDIMKGDEELGLYDEQPKQDYNGVHLRHCYQGEYEDGCKYGEDDCPAKPKEEPNKTHYLDELPNMDRDVLAKMWKSAIPKLSTKQETIEKATEIGSFAEKKYLERIDNFQNVDFKDGVFEGAKWQQGRSYSETEVLQLLLKLQQAESYDNLYDWFEQVKKK